MQLALDMPTLPRARTPRVLSYGGGLDSFEMLLDAIDRGELPDVVAFVNVADAAGADPGEWPSTYRHIREVVVPLCARLEIDFVEIDTERYPVREARSLFGWFAARNQIPVSGPTRICTRIAKVERFERWLDDRFPGQEVEVWIGFEAGEEKRAARDPNVGGRRKLATTSARRRNRFPLMERGLCRCRCEANVRRRGYPIPRKSACVFCPYGTRGDWQRFAVELPDQFRRVVDLERKKPLTGNGRKLSIMGYDSRTQTGTPLPSFVAKPYRPQPKSCAVCGASERASKATGCDYLEAA